MILSAERKAKLLQDKYDLKWRLSVYQEILESNLDPKTKLAMEQCIIEAKSHLLDIQERLSFYEEEGI